jgi:hypothetical protein
MAGIGYAKQRRCSNHFGVGDHSNYLIALNVIANSQRAQLPELG